MRFIFLFLGSLCLSSTIIAGPDPRFAPFKSKDDYLNAHFESHLRLQHISRILKSIGDTYNENKDELRKSLAFLTLRIDSFRLASHEWSQKQRPIDVASADGLQFSEEFIKLTQNAKELGAALDRRHKAVKAIARLNITLPSDPYWYEKIDSKGRTDPMKAAWTTCETHWKKSFSGWPKKRAFRVLFLLDFVEAELPKIQEFLDQSAQMTKLPPWLSRHYEALRQETDRAVENIKEVRANRTLIRYLSEEGLQSEAEFFRPLRKAIGELTELKSKISTQVESIAAARIEESTKILDELHRRLPKSEDDPLLLTTDSTKIANEFLNSNIRFLDTISQSDLLLEEDRARILLRRDDLQRQLANWQESFDELLGRPDSPFVKKYRERVEMYFANWDAHMQVSQMISAFSELLVATEAFVFSAIQEKRFVEALFALVQLRAAQALLIDVPKALQTSQLQERLGRANAFVLSQHLSIIRNLPDPKRNKGFKNFVFDPGWTMILADPEKFRQISKTHGWGQ